MRRDVRTVTFDDFLRGHGIIPPETIQPGRWQRCATDTHPRKKNASVKLDESGNIGFAQDFASMTEAVIWRVDDYTLTKVERTAEENARLTERLAERRAEEIQGTMRARAAFVRGMDLRHANHPYLIRKRCDMLGCAGLKVDAEDWLMVPMYRDGKILSVQRINADGDKRFAAGAPTKGATFRIWRPGAVMQILCEGVATGLTAFAACPLATVTVCFSAANLIAVAEREDWKGMVAIASDNDADTEERTGKNPGVDAARRAAGLIGCGVAIPYSELGTDWNDAFCERLEKLEKENAEKPRPEGPFKLRQAALVPIRNVIVGVARKAIEK